MDLKSLTYTSLAALDIELPDLEAIHRSARELNALDGITGLLIFNGTHFLQIIEGSQDAIDDLVARLRRDTRHSALEIRDERKLDERIFPEWSMEMVRVSTRYSEAQATLSDHLPDKVPGDVRNRVLQMTEAISTSIAL